MPIIIFEGADGTGKTTAVKAVYDVLRERGNYPAVRHRGVPYKHPLVEYTVDVELTPGGAWTLCDRWHWGELIYGPLYRGHSRLTSAGHRAIDEFLAEKGAILVHMDNQERVVLERLQERGDDFVKMEHVPFILQEYRRIRELDSPLQRFTRWDVDRDKAIEIINAAEHVAHRKE